MSQKKPGPKNNPGILTFNPGSSSLKWACFTSLEATAALACGQVSTSADDAGFPLLPTDFHAGLAVIRFVHGGNDFVKPVVIDKACLKALHALDSLAPLHNRASLLCSKLLARQVPGIRQIAVFDTEFFHALPRVSQSYGLPRDLVARYGIRRFGFHGFAHDGMVKAWRNLAGSALAPRSRLVTAQLGSGCSMAAIRDGKPIDTTMGFTPNEGLLMSTRSGDIDPGLVTWLKRQEGWDADDTDRVLNSESGWLGMSGESANMGDLLNSGSGNAEWAIELFIHRIRKTLGAYYALLGGLDGVVFSGGIAEHAPDFCKRIIAGLEHLGIIPAPGEPVPVEAASPTLEARRLTLSDSPAACWCVPGDEHRAMLDSVRNHLQT